MDALKLCHARHSTDYQCSRPTQTMENFKVRTRTGAFWAYLFDCGDATTDTLILVHARSSDNSRYFAYQGHLAMTWF